ncbi:peptidoglycan glycosyltransferase [Nocardiopsis mwathae]|uniref:Peptidoglycan glycosyltransferase n=1 Tax=Nocardiopsis mwathae TaxID=1472723 RepID=A0A7W9YLF2_9ACTN|nr:penicillin-binding protein 2 [Nocardiopsis mwathae]MBB6174309.1 peptidoglycan glycosyltransferase [Nocardiopsis mwathae]
MNRSIRRLSVFLMALFVVLLLNVTWIQGFQAEELRENEHNTRRYLDRLQEPRGPIVIGETRAAYSTPLESTSGGGQVRYQREYPEGPLYSHVVGTFRTTGASGIEDSENELLNGTDDRLAVRNLIDLLTGERPTGATVALTLDPAAQRAARDGLAQLGRNGAAVALDPSTGAVLAAYSAPTFDPGEVTSVTHPQAAADRWEQLSAADSQPLLNRAFNQTYPPGSAFKIVTAAAALENGATPESTQPAPAVLALPQGGTLPNAFSGPCNDGAPDTLAHSIEISCNTSMANWALALGEDEMREQAERFGFDRPGLEIPSPVAQSVYPTGMGGSSLAQTGIGQFDVRATPLQMAMVAAGVANGGEVMRPYLVDRIADADLEPIMRTRPEAYGEAMSAHTAEQLTRMMVSVTEGAQGSGRSAAIPGVQVAGKTGTAETSGPTHNWFIAFAPADDPRVAVAVVVEHGGGSGGTLAAPIARSIIQAVLDAPS